MLALCYHLHSYWEVNISMSTDTGSITPRASRPETARPSLPEPLERFLQARHHNPFDVLGRHPQGEQELVRAFLPRCTSARILELDEPLTRIEHTDLFEWRGARGRLPRYYQLAWIDQDGTEWISHDPYCFAPQLGDLDLHWFGEGRHLHAYRVLGAHVCRVEGIEGTRFAVWAPNAERVSVVGDWNHWDGRCHAMRSRGDSGIWELFIPGLSGLAHYKYEIRNRRQGSIHLKSDPYGQSFELRPGTASVIRRPSEYQWQDAAWMEARAGRDWLHAPRPYTRYTWAPGNATARASS